MQSAINIPGLQSYITVLGRTSVLREVKEAFTTARRHGWSRQRTTQYAIDLLEAALYAYDEEETNVLL